MKRFSVSLSLWMLANPGILPRYDINIYTTGFGSKVGEFVEFCEYKHEGTILLGVKIKSGGIPLIGPIHSSTIFLPISYLREVEIVREDKIDVFLSKVVKEFIFCIPLIVKHNTS